MNLEDLAGAFAGEPSYATFDEPKPKEMPVGIDLVERLTTGFMPGTLHLTSGGIAIGKSHFAALMRDIEKVRQGAVRMANGSTVLFDSFSEFSEAMIDMEAPLKETVGYGGKHIDIIAIDEAVEMDNDHKALAAAKKRKDRGQKFPGTGWGKRK